MQNCSPHWYTHDHQKAPNLQAIPTVYVLQTRRREGGRQEGKEGKEGGKEGGKEREGGREGRREGAQLNKNV